MSAAQDVRREYVERHQRGQHHWQPGPYVPGNHPDPPASIILVCGCSEVRRVKLPPITRSPALAKASE